MQKWVKANVLLILVEVSLSLFYEDQLAVASLCVTSILHVMVCSKNLRGKSSLCRAIKEIFDFFSTSNKIHREFSIQLGLFGWLWSATHFQSRAGEVLNWVCFVSSNDSQIMKKTLDSHHKSWTDSIQAGCAYLTRVQSLIDLINCGPKALGSWNGWLQKAIPGILIKCTKWDSFRAIDSACSARCRANCPNTWGHQEEDSTAERRGSAVEIAVTMEQFWWENCRNPAKFCGSQARDKGERRPIQCY